MPEYLSIETDAGSFDAITAGPDAGRAVLLLHGFPEASIEWRHQVAALGEAGLRAVAPDQRGYSPAVRPESAREYTITHLVDDVIAIADALGWERFDLVGHDWGGTVAWWTASEHPDRVRSLTVVSTPHPAALADALRTDEDQANRAHYMTEWRRTPATEDAMLADNGAALRRIFDYAVPRDVVEEYLARLREPGALTAALNWYRSGRPPAATGAIEAPTLYIWPTDDAAFGDVAALATGDHVRGRYRFEMLEDVSHWAPEQAPEAVTSLLFEHLHSVRP